MKRGQRVLSLKLFNSVLGKIYDSFHLWVSRHLHESQGCFCHRGDWCSEDRVRDIVEFVVEVAQRKTGAFDSLNPALPFMLISSPTSRASIFIFILWSVLGQIVC